MQAQTISSRTVKPSAARSAVGTSSLFHRFRSLWRARPLAEGETRDDGALLWDAHGSMKCGNHARSWKLLSEWLRSRGDQPADYGWLSARISNWEDGRVIARLTEARVARLLALKRPTEALDVVAQQLIVDPHFRPYTAADTLTVAQIAARSGAQRISLSLLSDFGVRFAGDPRVSISEALKRRLSQQASSQMRVKAVSA